MRSTRPLALGLVALAFALGGVACGKDDKPAQDPTAQKVEGAPDKSNEEEPTAGKGEPTAEKTADDEGEATTKKTEPAADAPAKGDETEAKKVEPTAPAPTTAPAKAATRPEKVEGSDGHAVKMLPKDTTAFLGAKDPASALFALGYGEVISDIANAPELKRNLAGLQQLLGTDVTDLTNLRELGIEPTGEAGLFGLLRKGGDFGGFFFTLSDPAKFKATLDKIAQANGKTFQWTDVDGGSYVMLESDMPFIIRGKVALTGDVDGDLDAKALATEFIGLAEGDSLAGDAGFQSAMKKAGTDGSVSGYVNLAGLIPVLLEDEERRVEAIDDERWAARMKAEVALMRKIFGSLERLASTMKISQRSISGSAYLATKDDALVRRLLKPTEGKPAFVTALTSQPLYMTWVNLDPKVFMELIELAAKAEGEDLGKLKKALKKELGWDLDKDFIALLGGKVGFAVEVDLAKLVASMPDSEQAMMKHVGGHLAIELTDADKLAKVVDALLGNEELASFVKKQGEGSWAVAVPEWKTLSVNIGKGYLSVSTDNGFHGRLTGGGGKGPTAANPELAKLMGAEGASAMYALNYGATGYMFLAGSSDYAMPMPEGGDEATRKELQEVEAKLRKLEQEREQKQMKTAMELLDGLGQLAVVAKVDDGGVHLEGGQYINAESFAKLAEKAARAALGDTGPSAELEATRKKADDLRNKLYRAAEPKAVEKVAEPPATK